LMDPSLSRLFSFALPHSTVKRPVMIKIDPNKLLRFGKIGGIF